MREQLPAMNLSDSVQWEHTVKIVCLVLSLSPPPQLPATSQYHDRCEPIKTYEMLHFIAENKPLGTHEQLLTAFILLV